MRWNYWPREILMCSCAISDSRMGPATRSSRKPGENNRSRPSRSLASARRKTFAARTKQDSILISLNQWTFTSCELFWTRSPEPGAVCLKRSRDVQQLLSQRGEIVATSVLPDLNVRSVRRVSVCDKRHLQIQMPLLIFDYAV